MHPVFMSPEQREEYDRQWSSGQLKYINPVEALFPDANRPRDQYGFRILPGQQMKRLDMKDSIANVYLDSFSCRGVWRGRVRNNSFSICAPRMSKEDEGRVDLDFITVRGTPLLSELNFTRKDFFSGEKIGNLNRSMQDGKLRIPKTGNYSLTYYTETFYPKGHRVVTDTGKMMSGIVRERIKDSKNYEESLMNTTNNINTHPDYTNGSVVYTLQAGDLLSVHYRHRIGVREEELTQDTNLPSNQRGKTQAQKVEEGLFAIREEEIIVRTTLIAVKLS